MITYEEKHEVKVKIDGKVVGTIRFVPNAGWRYMPKGARIFGGEFFPTLAACKLSLGTSVDDEVTQ